MKWNDTVGKEKKIFFQTRLVTLKKRVIGMVLMLSLLCPTILSYASTAEEGNLLSIESSQKYKNMDTSYENGYEPTIKKNKVYLVLPLKVKGNIAPDGNQITASLVFPTNSSGGSNSDSSNTTSASSPFHAKKYEKEFSLKKVTSQGGQINNLYVVNFTVGLKENLTNGNYPIEIDIEYSQGGVAQEQTFQLYVTISQGEETDQQSSETQGAETTESESLATDSQSVITSGDFSAGSATASTTSESTQTTDVPKLLITNCIINPDEPTLGEAVEVTLTVKNLSTKADLKNLKLSYGSESGELLPSDTKGSIFLETISKNTSQTITFSMEIADTVTSLSQKILLSAEYEDKNHTVYTGTENIYFKIAEQFSAYIDKPVFASTMECGKKEEVKVKIFNTGKTVIKNAMFSVDVDGLTQSGTTFIGDIAPGTYAEGTATVVITQKRLGEEGVSEEEHYGITSGSVVVNYSDEKGEAFSEEKEIRTKIVASTEESATDKKVKRSSQWSVSLVVLMGGIYLISGGVFFLKKRRQP